MLTTDSKKLNLKDSIFWTIAFLTILANLLLSTVSVIEFYQLSFTDIEKEYHWGAEPFPWYYETKTIYLTYTGSWTVAFLTILFFQVYFAIKDNKIKELYSGLVFILLIAAMFIANGPMD